MREKADCSEDELYSRILPVVKAISSGGAGRQIIALDGRAASGKSSLARLLEKATGAGVIHMDDFFLPKELRTKERLAEPGGNVDYDRFFAEVLPGLMSEEAFSYRRYDCGRMELGERREVPAGVIRIVEGSYSCHPKLGDYMTLRVFCDVSEEEQRERIEKRNGEEMLSRFVQEWIPMEEKYFSYFHIKERADFVL